MVYINGEGKPYEGEYIIGDTTVEAFVYSNTTAISAGFYRILLPN